MWWEAGENNQGSSLMELWWIKYAAKIQFDKIPVFNYEEDSELS